jgi:hypothetical protein
MYLILSGGHDINAHNDRRRTGNKKIQIRTHITRTSHILTEHCFPNSKTKTSLHKFTVTNTLNLTQVELQTVRRKDKELEAEICRRQCEVDELMQRCTELENTLANSQGRAENLQKAVSFRAFYFNAFQKLR